MMKCGNGNCGYELSTSEEIDGETFVGVVGERFVHCPLCGKKCVEVA